MKNYYGVFCIASQLNEERNLDVIWETANKLYNEFLMSGYNDPNESELECINRFMSRAK